MSRGAGRLLAALAVAAAFALVLSPLAASLLGTGLSRAALALDHDARRALGRHLLLAACAAGVALALGAPFAILVGGTRSPLRGLFLGLAALTLAVPHYLAAEALIDLLGPAGRLTRAAALLLGGPISEDQARLGVYRFAGAVYSAPAAGFVLGACLFPLVALAVASADRRLDARVREAARLARGRRGAARVTARALFAPALGAALVVFAIALTEFAAPMTLRVTTLGELIFARNEAGDQAGAAAFGLILIGAALAALIPGAFVLARRRVASVAGLEGDAARFELRSSRPLLATLVGLLCVTPGFLAPLISLTLQARHGEFAVAFGAAWEVCQGDAKRTVAFAALAATIAVALAGAVGHALRAPTRASAALTNGLAAALAVPSPLVGLGLVVLWNRPATARVYDSMALVVLGWLARFLPVAVLLTRAGFARVPGELEEAATLAGRSGLARSVRVLLPLAAPGLVAAWLAVYVLSATEFAATQIAISPGNPLIGPTIVNFVHYGQDAKTAAAGLILVGAVVLPLLPLAAVIFIAKRHPWHSS